MPNENITTKIGIDISQFRRGLQDAQRQIKLANAEFKAASASMDKWSDSADGVKAKIKQLESVLDAENKKLELQKQRLVEVEKEQGVNSKGADELRIAIAEQQAAIAKTEKSLGYFNTKLVEIGKAEKDAISATSKLTTTIGSQEDELSALKKQYTEVALAQGTNSKEAKALGAQITALSGELVENKDKLSEAESAADKFDKSLNDMGDSAIEASEDAEKAADGGFTVLKGVLANLATEAVNMALSGLKNLGGALVDIGKQAVAGYSDFEQLTGGVETLFSSGYDSVEEFAEAVGDTVENIQDVYDELENAPNKVKQNAANAYKSAGMSANDYMETVTSFSASLVNSLSGDTAAAADVADMAIRDMADNANKMGTDMESISTVYANLAKNNYTTLDNLKLGYAGSKEGMLDLIDAANRLKIANGEMGDLSIESYADMIEAIHLVQTDMGITGATAAEAATTIEGSANSMKAAWQNLLTGVADGNADMGMLIQQFLDSLLTYGSNLIPVVKQAISGVTTLVSELIRQLLPEALDLITSELPEFLKAGTELIMVFAQGIAKAAPDIVSALISGIEMALNVISEFAPDLVKEITYVIPRISKALISAAPDLIQAALTLFEGLLTGAGEAWEILRKELPGMIKRIGDMLIKSTKILLPAAVKLFESILQAVPVVIKELIPLIPQIIDQVNRVLKNTIPLLLSTAIEVFSAIVDAIPVILETLTPEIPGIIKSICTLLIENSGLVIQAGIDLFMAILDAVPVLLEALDDTLPQIIDLILQVLAENAPQLLKGALDMFLMICKAVPKFLVSLGKSMISIYKSIKNSLVAPVEKLFAAFWEGLKMIFDGAAKWFGDTFYDAYLAIKNAFSGVGGWFKDTFNNAYTNVKNAFTAIGTWFSDRWADVKKAFGSVGSWFSEKFSEAWTNIKTAFSGVGDFFGGLWSTITEKFSDIGQTVGEAVNNAFSKAVNTVLKTATDIINGFIRAINNAIGFINEIPGVDIKKLNLLDVPQMAQGGILKRGQLGLLEGNGAEAVVPLDQNRKWIAALTRDLKKSMGDQGLLGSSKQVVNYNFTQNNTSPKPLNRLEIYRQTKNQLNFAKGV